MKIFTILVTDFGQVRASDGTAAATSSTVEGAITKLARQRDNEPPAESLFNAAQVIEGLMGETTGKRSQIHEGLVSG